MGNGKENIVLRNFLKTGISLVFFLLFSNSINAQRGDCKEISNPTVIKYYHQALKIPDHRYKEAIVLLNQAIELRKDYTDAHCN